MRWKHSCAATIAAILLVSQACFAGEVFPRVIVSVPVLKPYVDEVLKGVGSSESLLKSGQDPHHFALAPSQAMLLDSADILVVPDLGMSPFLAKLAAKKSKLKVVELSKLAGADPLPYAADNPWLGAVTPGEDSAHAAHAETRVDPHFWLDPVRMADLAMPLADAIGASAPTHQPALADNAKSLAYHLREELLPKLGAMLDKAPRRTDAVDRLELPFITYHAAYQYFLARFKLERQGEITTRPEETIGAKGMKNLLDRADNVRVRCLIGEEKTPLLARIAKATNAQIVILNPEQPVARSEVDAFEWLENDYDRLLYLTAKRFSECL